MSSFQFVLRAGPVGPSHLRATSFVGTEAMNELFRFDVSGVTPIPPALLEPLVLGAEATLALDASGMRRGIRGIISAVRAEGSRNASGRQVHQVTLRLEPHAWLLGRRKGSRVFRRKRVDQIIEDVARARGVPTRFRLSRALPTLDYATQYDETDLAFILRLAAENGLLSYFEHPRSLIDDVLHAAFSALPAEAALVAEIAEGALAALGVAPREVLVFTDEATYPPITDGALADLVSAAVETLGDAFHVDLDPIAPLPSLRVRETQALTTGESDWIGAFESERAIRPSAAAFREYDPERPLSPVSATSTAERDASRAGLDIPSFADPRDLELYEHGSGTLERDHDHDQREPVRILHAARRDRFVCRGTSVSARLEAGHAFRLEQHPVPTLDGEWVVTEVRHKGSQSGADVGGAGYSNEMACVPRAVPFVPERPERRAIQVCLTAFVVGPEGEEIHVNERGEIRVKFHWDRDSGRGDTSTWIRTMQPWAGTGWGAQFIPRVGTEVVVVFEEGDPDRPLVLGGVHNAVHPPPFPLPSDASRSGVKTRSTPQGEGYNELSFEDKRGAEQILVRAQRDHDSVVLRNRTAVVHADDRTEVRGHRALEVHGEVRTRIDGDEHVELRGSRHERTVGSTFTRVEGDVDRRTVGDERARVEGRARRETLGEDRQLSHDDLVREVRGAATMLVGRADAKRSATAIVEGEVTVEASETIDLHSKKEIVLRVGSSSIRIASGEIEIAAAKVTVRGKDARLLLDDGEAKLKTTSLIQLVSDDAIVLKSSGASLGLKSEAKLDGSQVLLNSPESASDTIETTDPSPTKIALVDTDGNPIPYQRYRIELSSGEVVSGFLDDAGKAEVFTSGGGEIVFPDLAEVDAQ